LVVELVRAIRRTRVQAFERGAVARVERAQKWRDQLSLELPEVVGVLGPQDRELALETANATREIRRELPVPAARRIRASPPGFADRRHDLRCRAGAERSARGLTVRLSRATRRPSRDSTNVHAHPRRSWGAWVENFRRSELPMPERIAVLMRNVAVRGIRRQACCGHDGEPGC